MDAPLQDLVDTQHHAQTIDVARRGRPAVPLAPYERELRVTPLDGKPISYAKWLTYPEGVPRDGLLGISAWEEGGEGTDKALHYHCMIRTTWSPGLLRRYILHVARDKHERGGNKVYRTAEPHEHTHGYIAKYGHCVISIGCYEGVEDSWKERSRLYVEELKKETERNRKQKALSRKRQLEIIREYAHDETLAGSSLPHTPQLAVERFVSCFLTECHKRGFDFPTKFQLESLTIRSIYRYYPSVVHDLYLSNMLRIICLPNT